MLVNSLFIGIFARRAPNPLVPRLTSLFAHTIFGSSMHVGWQLAEHFVPSGL